MQKASDSMRSSEELHAIQVIQYHHSGENVFLRALVPKECRIKLIHNGKTIDEKDGMNAPGMLRNRVYTGLSAGLAVEDGFFQIISGVVN